MHTRWIETEFANRIEPSALTPAEPAPRDFQARLDRLSSLARQVKRGPWSPG